MVGATLASFVVLAAGLYRLARASFGTLVGLAAAGLLCTRFDFPFLAARAYIDIPYLAFVVWAAALESKGIELVPFSYPGGRDIHTRVATGKGADAINVATAGPAARVRCGKGKDVARYRAVVERLGLRR